MPDTDQAAVLALAAALGWASGFRLYATLFAAGMASRLGWIDLPASLDLLEHPVLLGLSGLLLATEFLVDKIPGLDSFWDLVNSVIRVPAGAALAAAVLGADSGVMAVAGALLGGSLAASSQLAKTSVRAAINTLPEPVSNLFASLTEDGLSLGMLWLAVSKPMVFAVMLGLLVVAAVAVVWLLMRFLRAVMAKVRARLGRGMADAR
jgi:hypothetical protein